MLPELNTKEKLRKTGKSLKRQKRAYQVAEAITSRDHNNLYITSLFFKDRLKYKDFCAFYAVMRIVDDRIDNLPLSIKQNEETQKRELKVVDAWEQVVISCHQSIQPTDTQLEACDFTEVGEVCESLFAAFSNFPVPIQLWINFFEAMRSDIVAGEFERWTDFLAYAEGATVAPTTIYLYLIAARHNTEKNSYDLPAEFDLFKCGRYLGIFAYLGHIIRDLAEDIKSTVRLCITREDMNMHNVSLEILKKDVLKNQASLATSGLVIDILQRARRYLLRGQAYVSQIKDFLENDSRFILELIITIYEQVIVKIESTDYDPMSKKHYLSRAEKTKIVKSVAFQNGFLLPSWFENK
jgi:phytoene synthase